MKFYSVAISYSKLFAKFSEKMCYIIYLYLFQIVIAQNSFSAWFISSELAG